MPNKNIHVKHDYSHRDFARYVTAVHIRQMNIESLRRLKGLNQSELADMAGITQPTISRAERGDDGVTLEKFKAIALALKVPLSDIFQENRSRGENELLELYRRLPTDRQRVWLQMATALAADQP